MPNPAAAPTTDLKDTLEEMRASVAARGARRGLRGAIQEAILGFLETLLALLAEFRAGRLAAPASGDAAGGADGVVGDPSASLCAGPRPGADGAPRSCSASMASPPTSANPSALEGGGECHGRRPDGCGAFAGLDRAAGQAAGGTVSAVAPPPPQPSPVKGEGGETPTPDKPSLARASRRSRRFGADNRAHPAARAAVAGCARRSPGFPALQAGMQRGVERADSKNRVLRFGETGGVIVPA